ncbi:MAG: multidrug resistance efflux transporter family protein [Cystobacter sp.]
MNRPEIPLDGRRPSGPALNPSLLAILLGVVSALFFTMTYVLNRNMAATGGYWAWTTCLRYFIMLPLLLVLVMAKRGLAPLWAELRRNPRAWVVWGCVGFGVFYTFLALAAEYGPSWLIAGSFQLTALAGPLMSPLIYTDERRRIPLKAVGVGSLIVVGVLVMQWGHFEMAMPSSAWLALLMVLISAIAYPLGNRMLMLHLEQTGVHLDAGQRVLGMTVGSLPLWLVQAAHAGWRVGWPPSTQVAQSAGVALLAGVIGTTLFFRATQMAANNPVALAAVEATQSAELLFALLLGVVFLGESWPSAFSALGAVLIVVGMVLYSFVSGGSEQDTTPVGG